MIDFLNGSSTVCCTKSGTWCSKCFLWAIALTHIIKSLAAISITIIASLWILVIKPSQEEAALVRSGLTAYHWVLINELFIYLSFKVWILSLYTVSDVIFKHFLEMRAFLDILYEILSRAIKFLRRKYWHWILTRRLFTGGSPRTTLLIPLRILRQRLHATYVLWCQINCKLRLRVRSGISL